MAERTGPSIEVKSPIGRALILQVLSALMIIANLTMAIPTLHIGALYWVVDGGLYLIGFIQILNTRAVMQRESWSIPAALVFSILALFLSVIGGVFRLVLLQAPFQGLYFTIIAVLNITLAFHLIEIQNCFKDI